MQYLSKLLPPKILPLTKDVLTPSKYLLGNNLNDRLNSMNQFPKQKAAGNQNKGCNTNNSKKATNERIHQQL